jgi:DNA polymerase-3 subunit delta'
MKFENVIGQTNTKRILRGMVESGRMPHALLLLGASGAGALALALAYTQYVLCENKTESGDSCGVCSACHKTAKFIHPDLHFSYPTVGAKATSVQYLKEWRKALHENVYMSGFDWLQKLDAENRQGNITRDECAEILNKLSLKVFEGNHKILLMWLPEYLGNEGNRLLKLLEEPPEDTLFILVAENQEQILTTILSRCQLVKVPNLSDEEVSQGLLLRGVFSQLDEAQSIAHLSDGNLQEAMRLAQDAQDDNAAMFLDLMRRTWKGNGVELLSWVEKFAIIGREKQKLLFKYGLHFLREVLFLKMTGRENLRLRQREKETALQMQKVLDLEKIEKLSTLFDDCTKHIERNANPKILFLDTTIQMHKILRGES